MPSPVTTPNMGLIEPGIGSTLSPTWAQDLNQDMVLIDQHDHTPGKGAPLTPTSFTINTDLPFLDNNAIDLRSVRFTPQLAPLALGTDIGCIYVSGVDLYYNDVDGNQIRLTASGSIIGTPGSIANLISPASATYVPASQTFVWQANSGIAANMDAGTLIVRYPGSYPTPAGNAISIQAPASLSSAFSITLPTTLPTGGSSVLMINNAGQISDANQFDGTSININGSQLIQVAPGGVTSSKIASGTILHSNMGNPGSQSAYEVSSSCGTFSTTNATATPITNLSVTVTATGRSPIFVGLIPDGVSDLNPMIMFTSGTANVIVGFQLDGSSTPAQFHSNISPPNDISPNYFAIIAPPSAGSHTFVAVAAVSGGNNLTLSSAKLVAYEIL